MSVQYGMSVLLSNVYNFKTNSAQDQGVYLADFMLTLCAEFQDSAIPYAKLFFLGYTKPVQRVSISSYD